MLQYQIEQLELMQKASCGTCTRSQKEQLYYSAKQKIREVMLQRFAGTDDKCSWQLFGTYRLFSSVKSEDFTGGFAMERLEVWTEDVDYLDHNLTAPDCVVRLSELLWALCSFTGIIDGYSLHVDLGPGHKRPAEGYRACHRDILTDVVSGEYGLEIGRPSEEERDEVVDTIVDFLIACDEAADGFIEEAMDDEIFGRMVSGLNENLGDIYTPDFIIRHLSQFVIPFYWATPDCPVSFVAFSSREIYEYGRYKDKLPDDIRSVIDKAIEIYDDPFTIGESDAEDIDETASHEVISVYCQDSGESLEDIGVFWKDIKDFLMKALPELREQYSNNGNKSGSLNGSRTYFFCC